MGIAERQIHVKFVAKQPCKKCLKPLSANAQTVGDWIRIRRAEKNLTSGQVAFKMGIAQSVVRSWEDGNSQPDALQLELLATILGSKPDLPG